LSYCYAKGDAITKRRITLHEWKNEIVRPKDVSKDYKLFGVPIMFPGTHDFTESNFEPCCIVLDKLLSVGNRLLIVSKPRYELIAKICDDFYKYRENILFRFTIGSTNDQILSFWEPNTPSYGERKSALEYSYDSGFRTSVSIEPMLDAENVVDLVDDLSPLVNQSIWIGTMNHFWYLDTDEEDVKTKPGLRRVALNKEYFGERMASRIREERQKIMEGQRPDNLRVIYKKLEDKKIISSDKQLIFWKWHIKKSLGLPQPDRPEQWPTDPI